MYVAPADVDVPRGPPRLADSPGGKPGEREGAQEALQDVEEHRLVVGRGDDPAARDGERVAGGLAGRIDEVLGRLGFPALTPATRQAHELAGDEGPERPSREHREPNGHPLGAALAADRRQTAPLPVSSQLRHRRAMLAGAGLTPRK